MGDIKVKIIRNDSIDGFGCYGSPSIKQGEGIVLLNVEAHFDDLVDEDGNVIKMNPKEILIETIMHEIGHALEEYFNLEFDEDRMDRIVQSYRT